MNSNNKSIISFFKSFMLIIPLFSIILISCESNPKQIKIYGLIANAPKRQVVIEHNNTVGRLDTVGISTTDNEGKFQIEIDSLQTGVYRLKLDRENIIFLLIRNGDIVQIESDFPNISKNYMVNGSLDNSLLRDLNINLNKSAEKIKKLETEYQTKQDEYKNSVYLDSIHTYYSKETRNLYNSDRDFLIEFIHSNHESPTIYIALYQYFGMSPIFDINKDLEIFEYVLDKLKTHSPDFSQISLLESDIHKANMIERQRITKLSKLKPGNLAPEFNLNTVNGDNFLSEDLKNEDKLLVFWASWSQRSISQTMQLLKEAKPNQKMILISLDNNLDSLKTSINENNFESYINLCDFNSWESTICKSYGISKIPTFISINNEGVIERISHLASDFE